VSLRVPPGRSGRLWLVERLGVARRGGEILEQKLAALRLERERLATEAERTRAEWEAAAAEAGRWLVRAQLLAGEQGLAAAADGVPGAADVRFTWRETMGVAYPVDVACDLPPGAAFAVLGGSAAVAPAAVAYRDALTAAARQGAVATALTCVDTEIATTAHRLRVIEHRWIPLLESELFALRRRLEESQREETARLKWISDRPARGAVPGAPSHRRR
jgi:V/A-type H+-transporting ATPase subunit D